MNHREGRRIELRGTVQGVGLRPWVYRLAVTMGVEGSVRNGASGVTIEAYGPSAALDDFTKRLAHEAPPAADIATLSWRLISPRLEDGFRIAPSRGTGQRAATIPADLPTCGPCLREIFDRDDRRHGYAFTTCTNCGPRFSIVRRVPYDRCNTSMSDFPMCTACRNEYDSIGSRRFHAETNACPDCGPSLALLDANGFPSRQHDPLSAAADALATGSIVAIKGLGGYHLACDARDPAAVAELRQRKHRETKPFAVMTCDLEAASALVELTPLSRRLLEGRERPIVLLPRRASGAIAAQVAPGEARLGVFLPYTPVHHLLFARYGRPLVMTSANRADEPTAHRDDEAVRRLAGIADLFLTHDREITTRTDDSVAGVVGETPLVIRRSRGYVPGAVPLPAGAPAGAPGKPVIAAYGAHLKNAGCIAVGDQAYLGPHVGDLETLEAYRGMIESMEKLERFLDVTPDVFAHDLHPDYLSTRAARERSTAACVGVQHHHAHLASVMVEHGLDGPVLGLAWDGGGLGSDGTVWGGELMLATLKEFRRLATFRPLRLPGGDLATRDIWRTAVSALDDAYDGAPPLDALALFDEIEPDHLALVRRCLAAGVNTPSSHAVGRWIDAFAAVVLTMPRAGHEAQAAIRLEQAASELPAVPFEWDLDTTTDPWRVDLRPALRAAVSDLQSGREPAVLAARFHETLVAAGAGLLERAKAVYGTRPVIASGGCFHNARIVAGLERASASARPLLRNREIPTGDGGIALGQAAIVRARWCETPQRNEGGRCVSRSAR